MSRIGSFLIAGALALPLVPAARIHLTPTGSVSGTVRSERSVALGGAMVTVLGTTLRAVTGADGRYRIDSVPAGKARVTARMIGYRPATLTVRVKAGGLACADLTLRADVFRLEEVVVAGKAGGAFRQIAPRSAPTRDALRGFNTEEYKRIYENAWQSPGQHPLSTFPIDVDAASYTNIRRLVAHGELPVKDAVRVEEMIN